MKLGPYDLNTIIQGDCLDLMPDIPDASVDMILADLPYGTTACHWDSIIPLEPLWEQYKRIIKPRGAIVLTASQPFTSVLVMSNLEWFKYEWVWEKDRATGHLDANKKPLKSHENILVFGRNLSIYNPQITYNHKPANKSGGTLGHLPQLLRGGLYASKRFHQTKRYPRSIQKVNVPNHGEMGFHPTQKPVALFAYLIRTYTNPGDLVLDNVAGSGTTAIAAIETGRNWLCIEKDVEYYRIAKERIEQRLKQPFLFEPPTNGNGHQPEQLELIEA